MRFLTLVVSIGLLCCCVNDSNPVRANPIRATPVPSSGPPGLTDLVSGIVTDVSQRPLSDANVEWAGLAEAWGDRGHGVRTDANGAYTMRVGPLGGPGSTEGLFNRMARKVGYLPSTLRVQLNPAGTTVNFTLTPVNQEERSKETP
jgi:hypothetical protein